jgi:hypothetical protein
MIYIDEVSMISNVRLAQIHLRLNEIFTPGQNITFGNQNLIFFGDLLQVSYMGLIILI